MTTEPEDNDLLESNQRKLNFPQTLKAVLWDMFDVRKGAGLRDGVAGLNPINVILTGIVLDVVIIGAQVL